MELRNAGEIPTLETRGEAETKVNKNIRYQQIIECLQNYKHSGLTAKQIAVLMNLKGYIPTSERNFTAPRLTELSQKGIVEPIGKKVCAYSGKKVAVYALREVGE